LLSRGTTALLYASFVLTGIVTTLLGPILPWLSDRWGLPDRDAGGLFTWQFAGAMVGIALSGALVPRWGFRPTLVVGGGAMAAGCAALGLDIRIVGTLAIFAYGVGHGVTIPTTNLVIAEANPARRAAALSLMNLAWGAGAVTCAPLVAAFEASVGTRSFLIALGAALALVGLGLTRATVVTPSGLAPGPPPPPSVPRPNVLALTFGALFFLYVGTESALGGWVATYVHRMRAGLGPPPAVTPAFFWGPLLLGRALAPLVLRRATEASLVLGSLLLAALGTGAVLAATTVAPVLGGAALAGLGLASVFPVLLAWMTRSFGTAGSRRAAFTFALGGLGGATIPWLVGAVSTHFGSLRVGLAVPLLGTMAMIVLHFLLPRTTVREGGTHPGPIP